MKKIKIISALLFCFAWQYVFAYQGFNVNGGYIMPMEVSLYGGAAFSDTRKTWLGQDADFGGSGFVLGGTLMGLINNYFSVGFDFSYTNSGYGKSVTLPQGDFDFRMEQYRPMLLTKTYLISPAISRFSLYVPLGAGLDFARVSQRQSGVEDKKADTLSGFALSAGLGAEFNFDNNTFISFEGRYNWAWYPGSNDYDLSSAKSAFAAVKLGIRFDSGYEWLY